MVIRDYHAHLYYNADTIDEARDRCDVRRLYSIKIGRFHEKPVGPHPVWSCQITVSSDNLVR